MKTARVIYRKNPLFDKCPSCNSFNSIHRSHARNTIEGFLKNITIYKFYRCTNCGWRGKLSTFTITNQSVKYLFFYLGLIGVVALIVIELLKRFS